VALNGIKSQSDSEQSPYQKEIEAIDNVILCVASAEKMLREIGKSMVNEIESMPKPPVNGARTKSFVWSGRRYSAR